MWLGLDHYLRRIGLNLGTALALFGTGVGAHFPASWAGVPGAQGQKSACLRVALEELEGARVLHKRDSKLHLRPEVDAMKVMLRELGEGKFQSPDKKISAYLSKRRKVFEEASKNPEALARVQASYSEPNLVRLEDVPESYWEAQARMAREQGRGTQVLTADQRRIRVQVAAQDQKRGLDEWVKYLASPDANYPQWLKEWALDGVAKIGKFDGATFTFSSRTPGTLAPFVDLDREALGIVMSAMENEVRRVSNANLAAELQRLVKGGNFGKIYAAVRKELSATSQAADFTITEGQWVKYAKGSAPDALVQSLACKNTGWCTAGTATAREQLRGGDFHVYYSNDALGRPLQPRIAVRMEGSRISEVRGVAPQQNLDPQIAGVLESKLADFGEEGALYQRASADMKVLSEIERRSRAGTELTHEELRFLYQLDRRIVGFGYGTDPRIDEILKGRSGVQDLNRVFEKVEVWEGDLDLNFLRDASGLKLPRQLKELSLPGLTSANGLVIPPGVEKLSLSGLTSADGLVIPQGVKVLWLERLTSANGLVIPPGVKELNLPGFRSANGLVIPQGVEKLNLSGLLNANGLVIPQGVKELYLPMLTRASGLAIPQGVTELWLQRLSSANGLVIPDSIPLERLHLPVTPTFIDWKEAQRQSRRARGIPE